MQSGRAGHTQSTVSKQAFVRLRGFTLIELMVTIAVVAILAVVAVPSLVSLVNSNRLTAQANEVMASLQQARMEAIRRNRSVTVCRSLNGTTCADAGTWNRWITVATVGGEVLRVNTVKAPLQVTSQAASIIYRADGLARAAAGGVLTDNVITVCIPTTSPATNRRAVSMVSGSRISITSSNGAGACP